ncbi:Cysteine-rich outer membrane protein [Limihaloglobus sulfuriphilus]|uniref:Cysteine-rich outer membrane protein n=1 Tax=Limihaloglobus sulfuriphilus TaxID=1851148 RepID=A0A1Q2MAX2_9BACT|nr:DUF11 domain-containing protein [Limihaloglobus sulfuriphilus]AQQ69810.1 Cysteine-rich outer membrane protein [Limihaloglobus sulfuriphilus]
MKKALLSITLAAVVLMAGCYSCESYHEMKGTGPVAPGCENKVYWDDDCMTLAEYMIEQEQAAPAPAKAAPAKAQPAEVCWDTKGAVKITKTMPDEVQLNQPFEYQIHVKNVCNFDVSEVMVVETLSDNFAVSSTDPSATRKGSELSWMLGSLAAGDTEVIKVVGQANSTDTIEHCATVTYVVPSCGSVAVVVPAIQIAATAPAEVLLCDPIPVTYAVTNTGTGAASNVVVNEQLPSGLVTADGKNKVVFEIGTLARGETKEFEKVLQAEQTGRYAKTAVVTADAGLKDNADTVTVVKQPVLAITKTSPEKRYLGRTIKYDVTVSNKGDAVASNVVVTDKLPGNAEFVSASGGVSPANGELVWNLGDMAPGASKSVSVTVKPAREGRYVNRAAAEAVCAEAVDASSATNVEGIAAVLLEVIDVEDPIELGKETTYVITATNQGTSTDKNIKIVCELEGSMQYVSATGATNGKISGKTITFAPLAKLEPDAKATWKVVIKAVSEDDARFTVIMNTDAIGRPVQETEATQFYE